MKEHLTPARIVQELDKFIIGQADAKKSVAIALRNRWRRLNSPPEIRREIVPNNIMMIGPTGVGKTEIARRLAQLAQAPFIKVEASKFTEVGYVGRDVESMVRDLVEQSVNIVQEEAKSSIREKALENANEQILDILIPPVRSKNKERSGIGINIFNEKKEEGDINYSDDELNERTREKFRKKLMDGELEDRTIEVEMTVSASNFQVVGPVGLEGMDGLQDMLSGMMPKKKKKRKMTVTEAREYFTEEEAQKLIDMDNVTRDAIERAQNSGIIFIDEVDKIAVGGSQNGGPNVSREGVQRDLLPIVEGSVVNTKYGTVKTDHILFIAAGAFHVARPSDLIPELQGRFPIRVELSSLTQEDFFSILTQPQNALTKQYQALLESENVKLSFKEDAIQEIAALAFQVNQEIENIGARRLHTIMSNLLNDILFEVPDISRDPEFVITREFVDEKLTGITKSKDLSHYIL
ncbi:MAG: ATP-dependent protease ATPase subunit HslU [Bacteroidota bacterium]